MSCKRCGYLPHEGHAPGCLGCYVPDMVNHPPHYKAGDIECIDAMVAAFGIDAVRAYCRCAAFKYQWRADHKGASAEDIRKAVWYLRFSLGDDPRRD